MASGIHGTARALGVFVFDGGERAGGGGAAGGGAGGGGGLIRSERDMPRRGEARWGRAESICKHPAAAEILHHPHVNPELLLVLRTESKTAMPSSQLRLQLEPFPEEEMATCMDGEERSQSTTRAMQW